MRRDRRDLRLPLLFLIILITGCPTHYDEEGGEVSRAAYFGSRADVMLQGFHWESHQSSIPWWDVIAQNADTIASAGFTVVWLPPPSDAASDEGYLPREWYNLSSSYGEQSQLTSAISALHDRGVKVLADVVVNHRVGTYDWADFSDPAFDDNARAVTSDDEWGYGTGNPDTGDGYSAARDLDHTYYDVQDEIIYWLSWLKAGMGFDGWRYDYVRGYAGYYVGIYNDATSPYLSVGELWPDITGDYYASGDAVNYHRQRLMDWIDATGGKSMAFDFTTKWQLQLAVERSEYWRLVDSQGKPIGAIGWWPQMSVTFIDNHDTGPSPGGGQNHWPFPSDKVEEGYAYILTHPGVPCVYWPHFFDWGSDLRNKISTLIRIRREKGITSTSSIDVLAADSGKYVARIDDVLIVKIGPDLSYNPSSEWTLTAYGNDWAVWTKE
ncbi:alpha amylase catalytic region [Spirochaeta thermophila DSM 6578]|uniref:Alpha-amylase n=1 Tax=Winmispira thermophila (strain ATCC 700085 / DSM 6578 / Z-1203) TaxID=869211 RepID=G0GBA9_WINT7|nr:alpha-amylase C-terminal beta-sheet domain-containing protein [Spirochaeta thermophila]AEJ61918.1 alpha amylase catalytic region [Spirochaeta thermophila DSM 6578]